MPASNRPRTAKVLLAEIPRHPYAHKRVLFEAVLAEHQTTIGTLNQAFRRLRDKGLIERYRVATVPPQLWRLTPTGEAELLRMRTQYQQHGTSPVIPVGEGPPPR